MIKLRGPSKKRLKQYLEEDKSRINSLTNQLQEAQQQVQGLREELARERQKSAEYEKTIQELRKENARLLEQSALRESGEKRTLTEADEKKLIELYKKRGATETIALESAKRFSRDLKEAGITLHSRKGEVQGETVQELQQSASEPPREEQARELHQRQRERKRTHGVTTQEQREHPKDGFIEQDPQLKPGEFTPREERKFQQEGGRGNQRR